MHHKRPLRSLGLTSISYFILLVLFITSVHIYLSAPNVSDTASIYLALTFMIDSGGKLSTRLYDKRDDFDFHIVNFPFLSNNIPLDSSYGV